MHYGLRGNWYPMLGTDGLLWGAGRLAKPDVTMTGPVMLLYTPPVISWFSGTAPQVVELSNESTCAYTGIPAGNGQDALL